MAPYDLALVLVGLGLVAVAVLPRVVTERPLSLPILYVLAGAAFFSLPLDVPAPDPVAYGTLAERLAELGVILALMGAGLKLARAPGLRRWASTWRLLGIAMPLTIGGAAVLGWGLLGLPPAAALLLGAVLAPTDPVLASEVQVHSPGEGEEDEPMEDEAGGKSEVGFALTSEAGLNDGLAFPFTYLAILVATAGLAPRNWIVEWLSVYVVAKIAIGLALGAVLGWLLARLVFATTAESDLAETVQGLEAVGGTLVVYGVTETLQGYGFIAVFVAGLVVRHVERSHEYNETVHAAAEQAEQVLMVLLLLLFGGAVATGLLAPLSWLDALVAVGVVLLLRPLAGLASLLGFARRRSERLVIACFGIRGIGSFFYLAYGLEHSPIEPADRLWAIVGAVVLVSVVVHGVTASSAIDRLTREDPTP